MNKILKFFIVSAITTSFIACDNNYIDPITEVESGNDAAAPLITITSPSGSIIIPFTDTTTDFNFQYKVVDDIEIANVDVFLDGVKLSSTNSFLDYRIFDNSFKKNLGLGSHTFMVNATDLAGKTSTKSVAFNIDSKYTALYSGEKLFVPFVSGNVYTNLLTGQNPTVIGTPSTVSDGKSGAAYKGNTNSYLSFPLSGLYSSTGISFTFWYKVNAAPDRSGIITINDNTDDTDTNRFQGLRLFREGNVTSQTIKLNVGTGSGQSWNDGGSISVPASGSTWVHLGVTVSATESKIYFNGVLIRTATYTSPFDFSTSTTMTIGSGAPSFSYWNHNSDLSLIDELRVYNKALSEVEVKATMK